MKIIHCSDLHLDSRLETNLPFEKAQMRNNEICETFSRLVDYAVREGVEAVLIAGDLFDTGRTTGRTVDYILAAMERAGGIDFLYLRGNHDESRRALAGRRLPDNVKTFSDRWQSYRYGAVRVAGIEMTAENASSLYDGLTLQAEDVNIVMLHGQESARPGEGLVCLPRLRGKHIHYLALGHLHSFKQAPLDPEGVYCYCGCLEGRGFDECGEKGFMLLDVDGTRVRSKFVPFAQRTLHDIPVDITGLTTVPQIRQAMERCAEGVDSRCLVKFTLRGTYTPDTQKDLRFLLQSLESRFYFVKIKDESRLEIRRESYERDVSLKGEFIRTVMASDRSDEEKERIICWGIQALSGEEIRL